MAQMVNALLWEFVHLSQYGGFQQSNDYETESQLQV